MSIHFVTNERIAETSSKGNQEKWVEGNRWYKLDQFGYEALAETLISQLLELRAGLPVSLYPLSDGTNYCTWCRTDRMQQ